MAGTPDQDENVKIIREQFVEATPAITQHLNFNVPYKCFTFKAWKNSVGVIAEDLTFFSVGNFIAVKEQEFESNYKNTFLIKETPNGLEGSIYSKHRVVIKINSSSGLLLIEQSTSLKNADNAKGTVHTKEYLQNYRICSPAKVTQAKAE